jgi:major type 1 subunit fimbrin (pilin)
MNRNKTLVALAGAASLVGLAQPAHATSNGTITINGAVVDSTCDVLVNGAQNPTVTLPTVATTDLDSSGDTAGWTPINFVLSNCTAVTGATQVVPYLQTASVVSIDNATGNLLNLAGGTPAGNVQVALSTNGSLAGRVDPRAAAGSQGIAPAGPIAGNPSFTIFAGYIATGAATAGAVNAQVAYNLAYN